MLYSAPSLPLSLSPLSPFTGRFSSTLKLTSSSPLPFTSIRRRLLDLPAADRGSQDDFDRAFLDRVVVYGDGDLGRVAVGEGQRQLDLAEEVFLHDQVVASPRRPASRP